jgi:DHA1 family tetracycline resistance protein-like MFS transporter
MFGIGFIIGPILGGILGDWWVRGPFLAAALLNALNLAMALFVLPESRKGDGGASFDLANLNPLKPLGWALTFAGLLPLMAIFIILNLVGTIYGTVWALFGEDAFAWSASMIGLSLGAWGLLHAGVQMFLVGPVAARVGERAALLVGVSCELAAFTITAFAGAGWIVFAIMPLYALSGLGIPALQALTTAQVDADNQGKLQGVLASLVSLAAIFGPVFFGYVYFWLKPSWPGAVWLVGGAIYLIVIPLMLALRRRAPAGV